MDGALCSNEMVWNFGWFVAALAEELLVYAI